MKTKLINTSALQFLENLFVWGFIAMVILSMVSCKTVKQSTQSDSKESVQIKTDVVVKTDSLVEASGTETSNEASFSNDSLSVVTTDVFLSKPDSTGKQYPERITYQVTNRVKTNKKETNHARDSTHKTSVSSELIDNTDLKSVTTQSSTDKTKTEIKEPASLKRGIILLMLGLLFFVFLILRRFKLIKWPRFKE